MPNFGFTLEHFSQATLLEARDQPRANQIQQRWRG
jgi:hypothetical protein